MTEERIMKYLLPSLGRRLRGMVRVEVRVMVHQRK